MLLPERPRPKAQQKRAGGLGDWRTLVAAAVGLLIFGLVVVRLIQRASLLWSTIQRSGSDPS